MGLWTRFNHAGDERDARCCCLPAGKNVKIFKVSILISVVVFHELSRHFTSSQQGWNEELEEDEEEEEMNKIGRASCRERVSSPV